MVFRFEAFGTGLKKFEAIFGENVVRNAAGGLKIGFDVFVRGVDGCTG